MTKRVSLKGEDHPSYKKDALRRNKDHQRERQRAWRAKNRDKVISQMERNERKRSDQYRSNPSGYLFRVAKYRAEKHGIPFDITKEDIVIPDVCPITGAKLDVLTSNYATGASLDKVDNALGYVKGNVRVISRKANRIKGDGTIEQFEKIIAYMRGEI